MPRHNKRYDVKKTIAGNKHYCTYRATLPDGTSYMVEKQFGKNWKCECDAFWNNIRQGKDDPRCDHIRACQEVDRKHSKREPEDTAGPEPKVPEGVPHDVISCSGCGATERKLAGRNKGGKQRYRCKSCGRCYVHTEPGFEKNRYPPMVVAGSLNMLMSGMSYRQIENHINCFFDGMDISYNTIYYWSKKYTKMIKEYIDALRPVTGSVWSIDEAVVNVKRTNQMEDRGFVDWLWTAIDPKTRLVLATMIVADSRSKEDVSAMIDAIKEVTDSVPGFVVTDSLPSYTKPLRRKLPKSVHLQTRSIKDGFTNMAIERYHNEIREKLKVCRGLGNDGSAQIFCDLLRLHHNFVRPHMGLGGRTPAEAGGLVTSDVASGKYRSLIRMSASKRVNGTNVRKIAQKLGGLNEHVEVSVGNDDVRIVPKTWLENETWEQINKIVTGMSFVWMFNYYARYWIRSHNAPMPADV